MNETPNAGSLAPVIPLQRGSKERGTMTFGEAAEAYMAAYAGRDPTRGARVQFWIDAIGHVRLCDLDSDLIGDALDKLAATPVQRFMGRGKSTGEPILRTFGLRKPSTVNRIKAACGAVLSWSRKRRLTPKNWTSPLKEIESLPEPKGRERFLTDEEIKRLLAACRLSRWAKLRLFVLMAVTTGARRGELLALRYGDLDLVQRTATVHQSKNGDKRGLPFTEPLIAELRRTGIGGADKLIFESDRKPGQPFHVDAAWRRALKDARLSGTGVVIHSLRHSAASALARSGASLLQIGDLLGHRSPAVTRRYSHLCIDSKRQMVDQVFAAVK